MFVRKHPRKISVVAVTIGVAIAVSACAETGTSANGAGAGKPTPIRFAGTADSFSSLIYVADGNGEFTKNHIVPTTQIYQNGVQGIDAILGGQADATIAVDFAALTRLGRGKLEILAAVGTSIPGFHKFAVRDSISDPGQLRGKKVGILPGSNQSYLTELALKKAGLTSDQVKKVPFDGLLTLATALKRGDIDAAWVYGPAYDAVKGDSHVRILFDNTAVFTTQPGIYLLAGKDFVATHPKGAEQLLTAFDAAATFISQQPDKAAGIIAEKVHGDVKVLRTQLVGNEWHLFFSDTQRDQLADLQSYGATSGDFSVPGNIANYLDLKPLEAVKPAAVSVQTAATR